jgi:hypothetical protein
MRPRAVESAGGGRALCEPRYQQLGGRCRDGGERWTRDTSVLDKLGRAAVRWHGQARNRGDVSFAGGVSARARRVGEPLRGRAGRGRGIAEAVATSPAGAHAWASRLDPRTLLPVVPLAAKLDVAGGIRATFAYRDDVVELQPIAVSGKRRIPRGHAARLHAGRFQGLASFLPGWSAHPGSAALRPARFPDQASPHTAWRDSLRLSPSRRLSWRRSTTR